MGIQDSDDIYGILQPTGSRYSERPVIVTRLDPETMRFDPDAEEDIFPGEEDLGIEFKTDIDSKPIRVKLEIINGVLRLEAPGTTKLHVISQARINPETQAIQS